jgi:RNA-binding protein
VVTVADRGLTPAVRDETNRALVDHELIKVRLNIAERDDRRAAAQALADACGADIVQSIGRIVLLYKPNPEPDPRLSNVIRHGG